jgi:hypothetical protein
VRQLQEESDSWFLYAYALKSPITRLKYQRKLARLFDFISLELDGDKTIEQRALIFAENERKDPTCAFCCIEVSAISASALKIGASFVMVMAWKGIQGDRGV